MVLQIFMVFSLSVGKHGGAFRLQFIASVAAACTRSTAAGYQQ